MSNSALASRYTPMKLTVNCPQLIPRYALLQLAFAAIACGARGYVVKSRADRDLLT
jgi:hypothetical protein